MMLIGLMHLYHRTASSVLLPLNTLGLGLFLPVADLDFHPVMQLLFAQTPSFTSLSFMKGTFSVRRMVNLIKAAS
jgi:hypothetical protein